MRRHSELRVVLVLCLFGWEAAAADEAVQLSMRPVGSQVELSWPGSVRDSAGRLRWPLFEIQQSTDLQHWQPINRAFRADRTMLEPELRQALAQGPAPTFYRLMARLDDTFTAAEGAEVFGYASSLADELRRTGSISPAEFSNRYAWPEGHYLETLSWDPANCPNWPAYQPLPGEEVAYAEPPSGMGLETPNITHFRLNDAEAAVLRQNGFVASERLGAYSFPEAFYQVFIKDRPVFVSTDAILQAWHRSYLDILQELEEVFLSSSMSQVLEGMNAQIPLLAQQSGETFLSESLLDADYFLAVARSLLAGEIRPSNLGQDSRVAAALQAINEGMLIEFPLFGEKRGVDFSQFTVRGHYDQTETLKRYFRMMMWCGRIDLRLTAADPPWPPNSPSPEQSLRELGTAVVLHTLLTQAGQFGLWQQCDQVINTFVGWSDSMTFAQLSSLLTAGGIRSLADLPDRTSIVRLQQALIDGDLGVQNILGDYYAFPLGPARARLPRSFAVLGQKFVLDSWALSRLVWPYVFAGEEGASDKVLRRIPSALDVAFSAVS